MRFLAGLEELPVVVQLLIGLLTLVALVAVAWPIARSNWTKSTAAVWKEHAEALEARLKDVQAEAAAAKAQAEEANRKVEAMEHAYQMLVRDAMGVDALEHLGREVRDLRTDLIARFEILARWRDHG